MPKGTDTLHFIPISARKATYLNIVVADKPHKANPERVRFTVGGDRIEYKGDVSTKTADLTTAKCGVHRQREVYDGRHQRFLP
jgi:hypothetical protein